MAKQYFLYKTVERLVPVMYMPAERCDLRRSKRRKKQQDVVGICNYFYIHVRGW